VSDEFRTSWETLRRWVIEDADKAEPAMPPEVHAAFTAVFVNSGIGPISCEVYGRAIDTGSLFLGRVRELEKKVERYADVLRVFGVFYSACLVHSAKHDERPVISRKTSVFGWLMGLGEKVWLTADDFRLAGYVLHEDEPSTDMSDDEIAQRLSSDGAHYLKRHPEQAAPRIRAVLRDGICDAGGTLAGWGGQGAG
jgi:hypothetical protein